MQVLPPSSTGGPSRLFIMRPVATTLLMVAILLAGIIGYRALPVSALPKWTIRPFRWSRSTQVRARMS